VVDVDVDDVVAVAAAVAAAVAVAVGFVGVHEYLYVVSEYEKSDEMEKISLFL